MTLQFREANVKDIPAMQVLRHLVKENVLSNPALVTDRDCAEYLTVRGKGWVCEAGSELVGFGIADLLGNSIWALFVLPGWEGKGIGRTLQGLMLKWYFTQTRKTIWLTTAPHTRAETFYRKSGWRETAREGNGEIRFEMRFEDLKEFSFQDF
jgi:GNAT superfamily N-acetyltransferase